MGCNNISGDYKVSDIIGSRVIGEMVFYPDMSKRAEGHRYSWLGESSYLDKLGYIPNQSLFVGMELVDVDDQFLDVYRDFGGLGRGWIVSRKILNILQDYYLAPHVAYQLKFLKNGSICQDFYHLFFYTEQYRRLDYEKTCFDSKEKDYTMNWETKEAHYKLLERNIECSSYEDFLVKEKAFYVEKNAQLFLSKAVFENPADCLFDLYGFFLEKGPSLTISNRLLKRLQRERVKSLSIKELIYEVVLPSGVNSLNDLENELSASNNLPPKGIHEIRDAEMYVDMSKLGANTVSIENNLNKLTKYFQLPAIKKSLNSDGVSAEDINHVAALIKTGTKPVVLSTVDFNKLQDVLQSIEQKAADINGIITSILMEHDSDLEFGFYVKFTIDGEEKSMDSLPCLNLNHLAEPIIADTFYEKREALEDPFYADEELFEEIDQLYKLNVYKAIQKTFQSKTIKSILKKLPISAHFEISCGEHDMDDYVVYST